METSKPTEKEYKKWLKTRFGINFRVRKYNKLTYDENVKKIKKIVKNSDFWEELSKNIKNQNYDEEYQSLTGEPGEYYLWRTPNESPPKLHKKPYESLILKTFRKNVLNNSHWPQPPEGGWILPENWFNKINDITRTSLVVKYLDGIDFMLEKIKDLCTKNNMDYECTFEAKEVGYYAAHIHIKFNLPKWVLGKPGITISEIQITTQLQEVIRKLLHNYYKKNRRKIKSTETEMWQWKYDTEEFTVNYLGHILHYAEGAIMKIRKKKRFK